LGLCEYKLGWRAYMDLDGNSILTCSNVIIVEEAGQKQNYSRAHSTLF